MMQTQFCRMMLVALVATLTLGIFPGRGLGMEPTLGLLAEEGRRERHNALMTHGINPTPAAISAFFQSGFSQAAIQRGLPREPENKSEVLLVAIQEVGLAGFRENTPHIRAMIRGEYPEGATRIIRMDVEGLPLQMMDERQRIVRRYVTFASVVTAGLLGDPALADDVHALMQGERGLGITREGTIALALMGDERALPLLAEAVGRLDDPEQQADLFATVFYLTGRNYGVREVTSAARRREAVEEFRAWVATQGAVDGGREDILRRRRAGMSFPDPPVGSLRGALRALGTFGDFERRYAAREHLRRVAPDSASELKAIAENPLEDLDIRQQALQWYSAVAPREARRVVRDLRNDENRRIREAAQRLEPEIEAAIQAEGGRRWGLF